MPARAHGADDVPGADLLTLRDGRLHRLHARHQPTGVRDADHAPVDHPPREGHPPVRDGPDRRPRRGGEVDPAMPRGVAMRGRPPRLDDGEPVHRRGPEHRREQGEHQEHARAEEERCNHADTFLLARVARAAGRATGGEDARRVGCGGERRRPRCATRPGTLAGGSNVPVIRSGRGDTAPTGGENRRRP